MPHKDVAPLFKYEKPKFQYFHKASEGAPARAADSDTFRDLLVHKLKSVKMKGSRLVEYDAKPAEMEMVLLKLRELAKDNFRVIVPHNGWGAQVGHRPHSIVPKKIEGDDGKVTWEKRARAPKYKGRAALSVGYGDGFLGLHDHNSIVNFIEALNEVMEADNKWIHHMKEFHRLARKHIPDYEEKDAGKVKILSDGSTRVINPVWGSQEEYEKEMRSELKGEMNKAKKEGHNKLDESHPDKKRYKELKLLDKYMKNLSPMLEAVHKSGAGTMSILTPEGKGFDKESGFEDSPQDSVWRVDSGIATELLRAMGDGVVRLGQHIPVGEGGRLDHSQAQKDQYRKDIIGTKSIGIAPDDRFDEMERLLRECQIETMVQRIHHQPATFRDLWPDENEKVTRESLVSLCQQLRIVSESHFPRPEEMRGQIGGRVMDPTTNKRGKVADISLQPEGVQNLYKFRMMNLRKMAEEAWKRSVMGQNPALPDSLWDFNRGVAPPPYVEPPTEGGQGQLASEVTSEDIQASFDSPLDSAFSILKNIV